MTAPRASFIARLIRHSLSTNQDSRVVATFRGKNENEKTASERGNAFTKLRISLDGNPQGNPRVYRWNTAASVRGRVCVRASEEGKSARNLRERLAHGGRGSISAKRRPKEKGVRWLPPRLPGFPVAAAVPGGRRKRRPTGRPWEGQVEGSWGCSSPCSGVLEVSPNRVSWEPGPWAAISDCGRTLNSRLIACHKSGRPDRGSLRRLIAGQDGGVPTMGTLARPGQFARPLCSLWDALGGWKRHPRGGFAGRLPAVPSVSDHVVRPAARNRLGTGRAGEVSRITEALSRSPRVCTRQGLSCVFLCSLPRVPVISFRLMCRLLALGELEPGVVRAKLFVLTLTIVQVLSARKVSFACAY